MKFPQAFPHHNPKYDGNCNEDSIVEGMTLLDYFAAKAMQSRNFNYYIGVEETKRSFEADAKICYQIARAMMKERESHIEKNEP